MRYGDRPRPASEAGLCAVRLLHFFELCEESAPAQFSAHREHPTLTQLPPAQADPARSLDVFEV